MSNSLCEPMVYSPPGSFIHGILQARILEWVAIHFSGGSSQRRDQTQVSCIAGRFFTIFLWATRGKMLFIGKIQFSHSVISNSLWPHGVQHARLSCPSPTWSNSCPLSWWYHPTILSSVIPFSSCLQSFPAPGSQSNESVLCIRWPKYWHFSFSISPSNEYSGLISFRMDWLDLLVVQGTLESLLQHHSQKHQFFGAQLYGPALTSLHDHWKNHSFD